MRKVGVPVVVAVLVAGTLAGLYDAIVFVTALVAHAEWTSGSYHQPVLTALYIFGGVVCGVLALAGILGAASRANAGERKTAAGLAVLFLIGAVPGLWLPFIHVGEVDVAGSGFRQDRYVTTTKVELTFFDASSGPVTVCLGTGGTCVPAAASAGPAVLRAPGLRLRPGQLVSVAFDRPGRFALTIVAAAGALSRGDTVIESSLTYCEQNPDAQSCICGSNGC